MRPGTDYEVKADMPVAFYATKLPKDKSSSSKSSSTSSIAQQMIIGSSASTLPVTRDGWLFMTFDRDGTTVVDRFNPATPPEIPQAQPGVYAGEVFNPATAKEKDLGLHLQSIQKANRLDRRVVLHLVGGGEWPTSPVKIRGADLVLYFEPGDGKDSRPFVLEPKGKFTAQDDLIDVQDGSLEIIGGEFRMPPRKDGYPAHIFRVTRGSLRMHACKVHGPLPQRFEPHRSLVRFENQGDAATSQDCIFDECVFLTAGTMADIVGSNLQLRMQGCLAVSGQELFKFDLSGTKTPRLRMPCLFEQNTLAARSCLLHFEDTVQSFVPLDPSILLARGNVFLAPFVEGGSGKGHRSGLLICHPDALVHGSFLWYGEGNVYDKRLHYVFAASQDAVPQKPQDLAWWGLLWSCPNDLALVYEGKPPPQVDLANPRSIENLQIPADLSPRTPPPGADLVKLGVRKQKGS
jgi:hypothetical protein